MVLRKGECMGLLRRKKQRTRADTVAYWLNGDDAKSILCPPGYTRLIDNEEVRKCTHKIADLISNMTIMLMMNGENGDIRIKNELSRKVDIEPSKIMIRKQFIYKIVTDMILYGNAVVLPEYSGEYLDNMNILKADRLNFDETANGYKIRYGSTEFEPSEVLHFVFIPDDDKPFMGVGYAKQVKESIDNLLQANATKTGFLRSKWKPSLIISIQADIEELQDKDMRNTILGSYTDTTEVGEPWLIPAGELDVKEIKPLTLADLAIQDSITLDKKAIATAMGVPPFMVGVGDFKKDEYNNFVKTISASFSQIIQQTFTKGVLYSPNMYFKMKSRSLLQYDLPELTTHVKDMVAGGMLSRNEGRNEFDYSPIDKDGMDEYNVLENYIPVSKVGDQKKLKGGDDTGKAE